MKTTMIMLGVILTFASCEKEKNYDCKCVILHEKFPSQEVTYKMTGKKNDVTSECLEASKKLTGTMHYQQTVALCKIQ